MAAVLPVAGRIGPNAITRLAEVLPALVGSSATQRLFEHAGLATYLATPPEQMVDEAEVTRLHRTMRNDFGPALAAEAARHAGGRTADYLLAHRIPKPVQVLLKALPAPLAARVLLAAIRRHAWTFAGSGTFTAVAGQPVVLTIRHNPLCKGLSADTPACDFYAAVFERLFRVLVHAGATVAETACEACGDAECRFELRW